MDKLQLEIIKKVLMLSSKVELESMKANVSDAIHRECDQDDHDQELFEQWKKDKASV